MDGATLADVGRSPTEPEMTAPTQPEDDAPMPAQDETVPPAQERRPGAESPPAGVPAILAMAPLRGLIGRSHELQRAVGALADGSSVEVIAEPGVGATALLRAICGQELPDRVVDGPIALPATIPASDRVRLVPEHERGRRHLVVVDDPDLTPDGVELLRGALPRSLLLLVARAPRGLHGVTEIPLLGLSVHHSLELLEAAIGRRLSLEEGRDARAVAESVQGRPLDLVRAAAIVREGGLDVHDVLEIVDPQAVVAAPEQTAVEGTAEGTTEAAEAGRDRDGQASAGQPGETAPDDVDEPAASVEAPAAAEALAAALSGGLGAQTAALLDDVAYLRGTAAHERWIDGVGEHGTGAVRRLTALGLLQADGRAGSRADLPIRDERAAAGRAAAFAAGPAADEKDPLQVAALAPALLAVARIAVTEGDDEASCQVVQAVPALRSAGMEATAHQVERLCGPAVQRAELARREAEQAAREAAAAAEARRRLAEEAERAERGEVVESPPASAPAGTPVGPDAATPWWRRRAVLVVAGLAILGLLLVVVPRIEGSGEDGAGEAGQPETVSGALDIGTTPVDSPANATLDVELASAPSASASLAIVVEGPDGDAFVITPATCSSDACSATVTFTPDRVGVHVADAVVSDEQADGGPVEYARVALTGTGGGAATSAPVSSDLAVTIYPPEQVLRAGESGELPIGVRNGGPDTSTGATLTLSVGPGAKAEADGCEPASAGLECALDKVDTGSQSVLTLTVTPGPKATQVPLRATVQPVTDVDPTPGNNAAGFTFPVQAAKKP